jgi:hypothetical protein
MGFLLTVLNQVVKCYHLDDRERDVYDNTISTCLLYLRTEFEKGKQKAVLWADEPWIIGHILLGIACSPRSNILFFRDREFNEYLAAWYKNRWNMCHGWVDVLDTACTLIGLSNYYVEREVSLGYEDEIGRTDVLKTLSSLIEFRFQERQLTRMTVYPIWKGRGFKRKKNTCFILMPFTANWSNEVLRMLSTILSDHDFFPMRSDELFDQDVMEGIWRCINEADLIIADCTERSPNVFYELGMAHTLGKDVIIIVQDSNDIPFDIKRFRYIEYKPDDKGYRKLEEQLWRHIDNIRKGR